MALLLQRYFVRNQTLEEKTFSLSGSAETREEETSAESPAAEEETSFMTGAQVRMVIV